MRATTVTCRMCGGKKAAEEDKKPAEDGKAGDAEVRAYYREKTQELRKS